MRIVGINVQLPEPLLNAPLQIAPAPSLTVTLPVGVKPPIPGTVKLTFTACPRIDGLGAVLVVMELTVSLETVTDTVPVAVV
jgi:hypothetical protein